MLNHIQFFVTPWTVAQQAALSMGFPKQEYLSELPFPPPRNLPGLGIEPMFFWAKIRTRARVHPWDSSKYHNPRITGAKKRCHIWRGRKRLAPVLSHKNTYSNESQEKQVLLPDIKNVQCSRLLDSVGEGKGGMFQENIIKTCILSRVKQITSPGWMHETSARAWAWCTGKTQRDWVEREVGGRDRDGEYM